MNEEVLEDVVEETAENTDAQTVEENVEGVELTDTAETETKEEVEEKEEEQKGRFMTDDDINDLVDRRVRRKMEKYEREMNVYKDTENVLKSAVGGNDINEINSNLRTFYENEGYKLPEKASNLTSREIEVLARAEAEDIIDEGYEAMTEEANRLARIGYNNMTEREKVVFQTLGDKLTEENDKKELLKIGVKEDILKNADFKAYRSMFNSSTPINKIYEMYKSNQPKKQVETPGSMKSSKEAYKKTYYSDEEIDKLTLEDLDKPGVWEAVRNSMTS